MNESPVIVFWVAGVPKGQPRPRVFAKNGKARVYDPGTAEGWKSAIALAAMPHMPRVPLEGPVWISREYFFPRPRRLQRKKDPVTPIPHTTKPDIDNLDKALFDALTVLGLWKDDAQVAFGTAAKWYVATDTELAGSSPGVLVAVQHGATWCDMVRRYEDSTTGRA